uniref:Uncharacterized protein n=1 Tax=Tetranychus urticae TaxID=32264 RepID=T1KFD2_TETUR
MSYHINFNQHHCDPLVFCVSINNMADKRKLQGSIILTVLDGPYT